jgi:transcriptional regulator with XRE-family HTH domain
MKRPPRFDGKLPDDKIISRLIALRIARKQSREHLAREIGCSMNDIFRYEHGQNQPRMWTFIAWLQALGGEVRLPEAINAPDPQEMG